MIRFAENLNKMIAAGLGGALEAPSTEVAVGHRVRYMDASGAGASFETNIAAPIRGLRVDMQPVQAGSGDPSPDNICPITGRDAVTVYHSGEDTTYYDSITVQLGQTVYGGTVDVTGGKIRVDRYYLTLANASRISYHPGNVPSMWIVLPTDKRANAGSGINAITSMYPRYSAGKTQYFLLYETEIDVFDTRFTDEATARTLLKDFIAVYRLGTPFDIDITSAQLSTLVGENNVWSDAGDISLEYPYYEETEGY